MHHLFAWLIAGLIFLWTGPVFAYVGLCCGKCGGNMPMNIPGGGIPETAEFRLKVTPSYMHMDGLASGTHSVDGASLLGMPASGKFMAVPDSMDMTMLNLAAGYSFTDNFFAGLMFMAMDKRMDMTFNGPMAAMTGRSGFTMASRGMGDTMLMAKYGLFADDPLIPTRQASLLMGLSLPTGSIDETNGTHPLAVRRAELLPYGMQLGSGTFDPTLGLLYQGSASPWWWGANLMGTWRLYDNPHEYHLGNRYGLDLYTMRQFRPDALAHLQLNGEHTGQVHGVMDAYASGAAGHATPGDPTSPPMTPLWQPENYGGTKVFATAGLQWQPRSLHILDLTVQAPVYQNLNGPQLKDDWRVMLTWYVEVPTALSIRSSHHDAAPSRLGF